MEGKINASFKYGENIHIKMVKISIKKEWSIQSKLGVMGLIGSIAMIIAIVLLD